MKVLNILFNLIVVFCCSNTIAAQNIAIIPQPQSLTINKGIYKLEDRVVITTDKRFSKEAKYLQKILFKEQSIKSKQANHKGNIFLVYDNSILPDKEGAYKLSITPDKITMTAKTSNGIFYAIQTFRQLICQDKKIYYVNNLDIIDYPTFSWRSMMLDEGRYFKGEKVVKDLLDEMALLKMNVFHWHLTDDQGWRIEIKKYPKLTRIGAFRDSTQLDWYESNQYDGKPHGGFYTQKQIKEIIIYAAERHITVVPEIEMPGHSAAAIAAYPWLSASLKEIKVPCRFGVQYDVFNVADSKVLNFLEDVLEEVIAIFPSKVIHIGGDEVRYDQWNQSEVVRNFMKEKGFHTSSDIQVWFTNQISKFIESKGRKMMGWNDITGEKMHHFQIEEAIGTEKLTPGTVVQFWKGDPEMMKRAAKSGQKIVNSHNDFTYMDYSYTFDSIQATYNFKPISLKRAYEFTPIPKGFPILLQQQIIGGSCQMWGEWIPTVKKMNYHIYPRIAAYSEALWGQAKQKNYQQFQKALPYFLNRWKSKGIIYGPINF